MATKGDFGRVYFPGNPWPKGHQIVECHWSGRIERSTGVWFDFHIVSEAFDVADKGNRFPDEDDDLGPTESRVLWCNHHHMTLSTTNWPGLAYGFQAGPREEPFDYRKLSGKLFHVDNPPISGGYPRPLAEWLGSTNGSPQEMEMSESDFRRHFKEASDRIKIVLPDCCVDRTLNILTQCSTVC